MNTDFFIKITTNNSSKKYPYSKFTIKKLVRVISRNVKTNQAIVGVVKDGILTKETYVIESTYRRVL